MNIFQIETIKLIFIFFVPGFISLKIYGLLIPSKDIDFSKSFYDAISFSCINFAISYVPWTLIDNNMYKESPICFYLLVIALLLILPAILPILYLSIIKIPFIKNRIIDPYLRPWDYLFSKKEPYWIIIHLKDGRNIGGRYDKATNSFASSFPADEQLYIGELWELDEKGAFVKAIPDSKGLIISSTEFESIEFFQN